MIFGCVITSDYIEIAKVYKVPSSFQLSDIKT